MAYDGLVNYSIVNELKNKIINGKIDKIYEPNFDEIILEIYCSGNKYSLNFNINSMYYRANLTKKSKQNPTQAPNFCMTLRKYLQNTHITNIYTKNLERIIFLDLEGYNKSKDFSKKTLIVELMGKYSNIILVDNNNDIIDSLKHFSINSGSNRNIYSGSTYELPNSSKLDFFDVIDNDEFYKILENNAKKLNSNSLSKIISSTFTGISKNNINSFEKDLNISDELNIDSSNNLYILLHNIITSTKNISCKNFEKDYSLFFSSNKNDELEINHFLDEYYIEKESSNTFKTYKDYLLKIILVRLKKLNSKLLSVNDKIKECQEADKYKLYGELITSNLYRINDYNTDKINIENYYDNNNLITIPLDNSITPSANAKKFFKKYKKLKNAKEFVDVQKKSLNSNINYLESIVYEINAANDIQDLDDIYAELKETMLINEKSKKAKKITKKQINNSSLQDYLKFNIDGFTVLVGKNNKQNDYLTTKVANKDDIWLHVKDFHGSHVILRTDNKMPSQETINKCAMLAKEHSKAHESSNITVDYTYVQYVKKPSGSKPGMVIYTHEQSVTVK
jgi:predicted ribosome quality control (RQC) complex YloA/Tae2 family protein